MAIRPHRRYSAEFKLRLVEPYLAGERSAKSLATEHGIAHSLILMWAKKYRKGELTPDIQREEEIREHETAIAVLKRKIDRLHTELAALKQSETGATSRGSRRRKA
jgi:transposase-like protein